jgi:hypothetical protein
MFVARPETKELVAWLLLNGLDEYSEKMIHNGYDDFPVLLQMKEKALEELTRICEFKQGHKIKLIALINKVQESQQQLQPQQQQQQQQQSQQSSSPFFSSQAQPPVESKYHNSSSHGNQNNFNNNSHFPLNDNPNPNNYNNTNTNNNNNDNNSSNYPNNSSYFSPSEKRRSLTDQKNVDELKDFLTKHQLQEYLSSFIDHGIKTMSELYSCDLSVTGPKIGMKHGHWMKLQKVIEGTIDSGSGNGGKNGNGNSHSHHGRGKSFVFFFF